MRLNQLFLVIFCVSILLSSCKSEYKFNLKTDKKATLGKQVTVQLEEENGFSVDSVQFFVDGKKIASSGNSATVNTGNFGVGRHQITALVFYPEKAKKVNNIIEVFANKKPDIYTYKLINTYPHDKEAYTQGLEYKDGVLYETTGRRGKSSIRKVDIKTGKVLQKEDLERKYFGEGMTIWNDKIFWLTWESRKGFIYDFDTFKQEGEFSYGNSKQGWGLTHNDKELIKSDGTNRIWFLDPATQEEKRSIQVYTHDRALNKLNEIEYINGKIFSNYWLTSGKIRSTLAIINPETGVVEGLVSLDPLRDEILKDQKLDGDEVLNGIAYNPNTNRLYVTGKHWGKLFEIELVKK